MSMASEENFKESALSYLAKLNSCFTADILEFVEELAIDLENRWKMRSNVFICGNGGSAANALHMANDFHYGIGACGKGAQIPGIRVEALSANVGIVTCLANDTGYENIYSNQLTTKANAGDLLIVLSGSGNSPNVVNALRTAKELKVESYAIVAFTGGMCKALADKTIHFPVDDMQIAEDTQLVIGHLCMQWLSSHKPKTIKKENDGKH